VLAGSGYLIFLALSGNGTPVQTTVSVGDVFGKTFDEAKKELEAQGLKVADPVLQVDENAVPGTVIAQSPAASTPVAQGTTVTLTVAKAAARVPVPDLTDMTLAQAQVALNAVHLEFGSKTEAPSDTVAVGHILDQDPAPGEKVRKGSLVDVVLSTGPSSFALPDVTCLSFGKAKTRLDGLGLRVVDGGTAPFDPLCPEPNKVAVQDPSAGTTVHAGDTVTLYTNLLTSPTPS
jgi:beta-lactam-binding protein with PASTA domain